MWKIFCENEWRAFWFTAKKPFIILNLIYILAMTAVIRANFNYVDDLGRVARGYRGWNNFSRYLSDFFSAFIHANTYLTDISPLPQLLAVVALSLASVIILYAFSDDGKISLWRLPAVLPLGLSPYFLACLSYKFDAPYMALSVLSSVVPFLFIKSSDKAFAATAAGGILVMCTTYQVSSGIFLLVLLFWLFHQWLADADWHFLLKTGILGYGVYVLAVLIFRKVLMQAADTYVSTSMAPLFELGKVIKANLLQYLRLVKSDLPEGWLLLFALTGIIFLISCILNSKKSKMLSAVLGIALLLTGPVLAFGGYLVLIKPLFGPRAMYGIGAYIALLGVSACSAKSRNYLPCAASLCVGWVLFAFAFTYGNALAEQKRYTDYRVVLAMSDLNRVRGAENQKYSLQLEGNIGKAPAVEASIRHYRILNRLVPSTLGADWHWNQEYFFNYFALRNVKKNNKNKNDLRALQLPVVFDSSYHKIQSDGEHILLTLKR